MTGAGRLAIVAALISGVAAVSPPRAFAQGSPSQAVDRAQLLRPQVTLRDDPESQTDDEESQTISTANDPDLGEQAILRRSDRYQPFTVSIAAPLSYTSNVALSRTNEESDVLFTPGVAITYAPRITKTLFANVSVGQQLFHYDEFSELDFGSFDARAGLTYIMPQLRNLVLRAEYGFNRLTDRDFDEFYASHMLVLAAEMPFRIGRAQQISVGVEANFNLHADPDEPGRHEFSGYVGYAANLTRNLTLNAVARLAARDYVEVDRTDVSGILSLGMTFRIAQAVSLNATTTIATNDSNRDVFDYDVVHVGAAVAFTFRF
jgi:hypothetical protein